MAEGARLESVYTRKCIEGSNPSLTAKFKEKAWIRVQAFFAWCTAERGEKPRQGSTKRLRFGPPTAARRVSAANQALSHRQIQRESLDSRPGFFCMVHRREGRASFPLCDSDPHYRRLSTNLPLIFSPIHDMCPAVRRSFQQSAHGLSGRTKTQKLFLTGSAPLPIVAPRCSDDFATKKYGEVSEWLKEHAWKVCIRESVSRVRIPPSPPYSTKKPELAFRLFCMHSALTGRVRTLDRVRQNACVLDRQRRPAG